MSGFCVKIFFSSSQCWLMFQFERMDFLMCGGFIGLNLVTITGGVLVSCLGFSRE